MSPIDKKILDWWSNKTSPTIAGRRQGLVNQQKLQILTYDQWNKLDEWENLESGSTKLNIQMCAQVLNTYSEHHVPVANSLNVILLQRHGQAHGLGVPSLG